MYLITVPCINCRMLIEGIILIKLVRTVHNIYVCMYVCMYACMYINSVDIIAFVVYDKG